MRFAALGRTRALYQSIERAVERGHECVLIGTSAAASESDVGERDFESLASKLGGPYFCDVKINQQRYVELARESRAEVGISVNWKTLIREPLLSEFRHGIINAHTGDLPRYRGNATPNWAILNGESKIVLTLHRMVAELDAGPILLQAALAIDESTYIADVYAFEDETCPALFADAIDQLAAATLIPREQEEAGALRCYPRLARDNRIDWSQSATQIARLVRAMSRPFDGAFSFLGSERLIVWRARSEASTAWFGAPGQVAERRADGSVAVCTGDGFLVLEEIEVVGAEVSTPRALIPSIRLRLGLDAEAEIESLREEVRRLDEEFQRLRSERSD